MNRLFQSLQPISISLSPNTEKDDVWLALRLRFQPWRWKRKEPVLELEKKFSEYLGVRYAYSFNSGRSSLMAILHALGLQKGDEVLLQAFTCNAVPNPVMWEGLRPVYVDCRENDFNIDPADVERKITPKSRAVIVQHTFGMPADLDRIMEICNRRNLVLIEDCAHALGAKYKGKLVGTFGKASFFSFSRDKIISSVYGGMAATNDKELAEKIAQFQQKIGLPSFFWIHQQLAHVILLNAVILPTYTFFGKYLLVLFQWLGILSKAVHWKEKRGKRPGYFPKAMPGAIAMLSLNQLKKLERFNSHRKKIAQMYYQGLAGSRFELPAAFPERESVFLRFAIRSLQAHKIIRKAWQKNLLLGDWYTTPIAPHDTQLQTMSYAQGSCLVAERLAMRTLNLPTHVGISQNEVECIVKFLLQYGN